MATPQCAQDCRPAASAVARCRACLRRSCGPQRGGGRCGGAASRCPDAHPPRTRRDARAWRPAAGMDATSRARLAASRCSRGTSRTSARRAVPRRRPPTRRPCSESAHSTAAGGAPTTRTCRRPRSGGTERPPALCPGALPASPTRPPSSDCRWSWLERIVGANAPLSAPSPAQ
eukprot:ctg_1316.g492